MSLRLKTIIGVAAIEAVLLVLLITTVLRFMYGAGEAAISEHARTTATLFATTTKDAVLSFDLASLESFVDEVLQNKGLMYARVIDSNGNVFAERAVPGFELLQFQADRNLKSVSDGVYDTFAEISEGGRIYGRVEIGISTAEIEQSLADTGRMSASIALFEMLLVALFSYLLGTYLTRQLHALRYAARKIATGDFDHHVPISGRDDVAEVAMAFNTMVDDLKEAEKQRLKYQRELESLNVELEQRVEKRTAQLSKKHDELNIAYEKLKTTQQQLVQSEKLASVGQLAAGVAHEINNPIGFINGNLDTLKEYTDCYHQLLENYAALVQAVTTGSNDEQKRLLAEITELCEQEDIDFLREDIPDLLSDSIDGCKRVSEIVQSLKSFSRVDGASEESADLNECVRSTLKMVNSELKYNCEIVTQLNPVPSVSGNSGPINQVITNLLVNAGQAIKQKGSAKGKLTVETEVVGINVVLRVIDSGVGIAEDQLPNLFTPFYTTKPVGEGTGLGLSISYGIIKDLDGRIDVTSTVGEGTTVTISLPHSGNEMSEAA